MRTIIIIGGGASGILSVNRIVSEAECKSEITIHIIERERKLGGIAYNLAALPMLVLNAQIRAMSAFENRPNDLLDWLNSPNTNRTQWPPYYDKEKKWDGLEYCPRELYGFYLRDIFENTLKIAREKNILILVHMDNAIDINFINKHQVSVSMETGIKLQGNILILCIGQLNSEKLPFKCDFSDDPQFIKNVWSREGVSQLEHIPASKDVLVIGTGLTANDIVFQRKRQEQKSDTTKLGHTYLISRHGKLHPPYPKGYTEPHERDFKVPISFSKPVDIEAMKPIINTMVMKLYHQGIHPEEIYREIVKQLLPSWKQLSKEDRHSLFNKYKYLDVYRTGVSTEIFNCIQTMKKDKTLTLMSADVLLITKKSDKFLVKLQVKRKNSAGEIIKEPFKIMVDIIFNASGFENNIDLSSSPLLKRMLMQGIAKEDYFGLGFECTSNGQLIGQCQPSLPPIFAVGAMTTGLVFEEQGKLDGARSIIGIRRQIPKVISGVLAYLLCERPITSSHCLFRSSNDRYPHSPISALHSRL